MRYFSASYASELSSFVLMSEGEDERCEDELFQLLCIAENLIQRGTPTPPSKLLQERLGSLPEGFDGKMALSLGTEAPDWATTIEGSEGPWDNPAYLLYSQLLPSLLPDDRRYVVDRILPEAPMEEVVEGCSQDFRGQRVDFYCHRARAVIEVDGAQHGEERQRMRDERRDAYLKSKGVTTFRVSAKAVKERSEELVEAIDSLARLLEDDVAPVLWHRVRCEKGMLAFARLEMAMRAQVALIEAFKQGKLDFRAEAVNVRLASDILPDEAPGVLAAAYDDLCLILKSLYRLLGRDVPVPRLVMDGGAGGITIDLSLTRMWSERETRRMRPDVIYVRNDYLEDRDRFKLATASPIAYKTTDVGCASLVDEALGFFLGYLFGYEGFNDGQAGIVKKALARERTLGILPTGSGKSLCYQMACLLQPCVSFVVCPIISLIQDQKKNLDGFGVTRTARIDSTMEGKEKARVGEAFGSGRHFLVWVSPERFQMQGFRQRLSEVSRDHSFGYTVIDEVHCLSEWGHDFRVSYLRLPSTIRELCPEATLLGLTATASRNVFDDLRAALDVDKANVQTVSRLDRPELHYHIRETTNARRLEDLHRILIEVDERHGRGVGKPSAFAPRGEDSVCGIVFSNTKAARNSHSNAGCESVRQSLASHGVRADTYHSGRGEERASIQERFLANEFTVMVATKSFGMGVNKKNVRYTVHVNLPWSIESFYQEAGRAGRDKADNESDCYILYVPDPNEERVRRLFSRETSVEEVHRLQPEVEGDLNTLLWLWTRSNLGAEEETEGILAVLGALRERCKGDRASIKGEFLHDEDGKDDGRTEKAIYKLAVMGVVKDWTVDYLGEKDRIYDVLLAVDATEEEMRRSIEEHIGRYGVAFSFEHPKPDQEKYAAIWRQRGGAEGLARALVEWADDYIAWGRRAAIGNMLELCESGMPEEELRAYINDFFQLDAPDNDALDAIVRSEQEEGLWPGIFYESIRTEDLSGRKRALREPDDVKGLSAMCDHYRESFHGNLGLEWVAMMAALLGRVHSASYVEDCLRFLMGSGDERGSLERSRIFERSLDVLEEAADEAREAFGRAVVRVCPERAQEAYQRLGDCATLEHLVSSAVGKLAALREG